MLAMWPDGMTELVHDPALTFETPSSVKYV